MVEHVITYALSMECLSSLTRKKYSVYQAGTSVSYNVFHKLVFIIFNTNYGKRFLKVNLFVFCREWEVLKAIEENQVYQALTALQVQR